SLELSRTDPSSLFSGSGSHVLIERTRKELQFVEIQAVSLGGLISLNQGDLAQAERRIGAALDLARATGRVAEEAVQLNNLGIVLRDAGRLDEAIATFEQALAIEERLGSAEGRAYNLRNIGIALFRRGEAQAA